MTGISHQSVSCSGDAGMVSAIGGILWSEARKTEQQIKQHMEQLALKPNSTKEQYIKLIKYILSTEERLHQNNADAYASYQIGWLEKKEKGLVNSTEDILESENKRYLAHTIWMERWYGNSNWDEEIKKEMKYGVVTVDLLKGIYKFSPFVKADTIIVKSRNMDYTQGRPIEEIPTISGLDENGLLTYEINGVTLTLAA